MKPQTTVRCIVVTKDIVSFPVAEQFVSLNGEGPRAGKRAAFLRFVGCNLTCAWCDTQWACAGVDTLGERTLDELVAYVAEQNVEYVTLTGGEPLLQSHLDELILALSQISHVQVIEIETNGAEDISGLVALRHRTPHTYEDSECLGAQLAFTLDYKLPTSGMESFMLTDNYTKLTFSDTIKFVVGSAADFDRMIEVVYEFHLSDRCQVYVSPVFGMVEVSWLAEELLARKLNGITLQLQLHKLIWPQTEKGV